jgi:hypothetical protein
MASSEAGSKRRGMVGMLVIALGIILAIVGWKFLKFSVKTLFWIMVGYLVLSAIIFILPYLAIVVFIALIVYATWAIVKYSKKYAAKRHEIVGGARGEEAYKHIIENLTGEIPERVFCGYASARKANGGYHLVAEAKQKLWIVGIRLATFETIGQAISAPSGSVNIKVRRFLFLEQVRLDFDDGRKMVLNTFSYGGRTARGMLQTVAA